MNDQEIIDGLKIDDQEVIKDLYFKHRDYSIRFMNDIDRDEESNRGLYNDVVLLFIENVSRNKFFLNEASIQTYLNSILKRWVWKRVRDKKKADDNIEALKSMQEDFDDSEKQQDEIKSRQLTILRKELELLRMEEKKRKDTGKQITECYKMLQLFHLKKKKLSEIASMMSYTNADNAKNQISRCRAKLRKRVLESMKRK
ncbi:MAG: sigma-70 family RNA polymerase sigma factor [Williamsia sp.]|nr:sigma-70 family RNA polymerase sigma factor [Williamsia sp.]